MKRLATAIRHWPDYHWWNFWNDLAEIFMAYHYPGLYPRWLQRRVFRGADAWYDAGRPAAACGILCHYYEYLDLVSPCTCGKTIAPIWYS